MIEVTYYKTHNRVTVKGHAGAGPEGHDLVCAAASALALTLAGNVSYMQAQGAIRDTIINLNAGDTEIQCKAYTRYRDSVQQVYRTVCVGFELLATQYPNNITYDVRG